MTSGLQTFLLTVTPEHGSASLLETLIQSNTLNFLIAVVLLGLIVKKLNVGGKIEQSRQKIAHDLERLEQLRISAESQLADVQAKTKNLSAEVDAILAEARSSAEKISVQILTDARNEASKIIENSKRRIEMEQKVAVQEIERRLLEESLSDARTELAQNLSPDDRRRSVEEFLEGLSQTKGAQ